MAYQAGNFASGDGFDAVHAKLKAFATAQGWAAGGAYPSMTLSKGSINAILNFTTNVQVDDTNHTGGALPDYRIVSYLVNGAIAGDGGAYPASMRDFPSTSNDWTGPYARYWFFSGADGDPDYIYMVVQKSNGNFCTWMLGKLDQKGVGYDGGEFINGVYWNWWFASNTGIQNTTGSGQGSDAFNNHAFPGDANALLNLRLGDALAVQCSPTSNPIQRFLSDRAGQYAVPFNIGRIPMLARGGKPVQVESYGTFNHRWLGHIYWLGPNPVNGITPMFEVFEAVFDNVNGGNHYFYMGSYPGYRALSMTGRTEAEEVTFGSDNYLIFPIKRFQPYLPIEPYALKTVTSGPYAHAFKINP